MADHERMHRSVATVVYRSLGGTDSIEKTWKVRGDEVYAPVNKILTQELKDQIIKANNLNPEDYK